MSIISWKKLRILRIFAPYSIGILFCLCLANAQVTTPVEIDKVFKGHSEAIYSVAFSPDGKTIATGSFDKSIKLFDVQSGAEIRSYSGSSGHQGLVLSVGFSKDGSFLASGSSDNSARVWDVPLKAALREYLHDEGVSAFTLSVDGKILAVGSKDGKVKLWSTSDSKSINAFLAHPGGVTGMSISNDSKLLVTFGNDGTLKFWNPSNSHLISEILPHSKPISGIALSSNANRFYTVAEDGFLKYGELPPIPMRSLPIHKDEVTAFLLSSDGNSVFTAAKDKRVKQSNVANGQLIRDYEEAPSIVQTLGLAPNSNLLVGGTVDGKIVTWNPSDGKLIAVATAHDRGVTGISFHPNLQQFITTGLDGVVRTWSLPLNPIRVISHPEKVISSTLSKDNKSLFTTTIDQTIRSWILPSGKPERQYPSQSSVTAMGISNDGNLLISGSKDGTLQLWDTTNGQRKYRVNGHTGEITSVGISPQNTFFFSTGEDGAVKIWKLPFVATRSFAHPDPIDGMILSSDGNRILTIGHDKKVRVWNLVSNQIENTFGSDQAITAIAITGDNTTVAIASVDKSVTIWKDSKVIKKLTLPSIVSILTFSSNNTSIISSAQDHVIRIHTVADGKEIKTLPDHKDTITAIRYSPKGDIFVTASQDKTIRVWNAKDFSAKDRIDHPVGISNIVFSKDGTKLLIGQIDKSATLINFAEKKSLTTITNPVEIRTVDLSPDGNRIVIAGIDNSIRLFGMDGKFQESFLHEGPITGVSFCPDSMRLVSSSLDKTSRVWTSTYITQGLHAGSVRQGLVTSQGDHIISVGDDKQVRFWESKSGKEMKSFPAHDKALLGLSLTSDGAKLLTTSLDKTIKVWTVSDGKAVTTITSKDPIQKAIMSPNGARIVTATGEGNNTKISSYDATTGKVVQTFPIGSAVCSLNIGSDNRTLYVSADDNKTTIYDLAVITAFPAHSTGSIGVFHHPSASQAITAGKDKLVRLWDLNNGKELKTFGPFPEAISVLSVSRDFSAIAASSGKLLKVWQTKDGKELTNITQPAEITSLGFNPDRTRMIVGGADNIARVIEIATGFELESFRSQGTIRGVGFHFSQPWVILSSADKTTRVHTTIIQKTIRVSPSPIRTLAFTGNGSHLIVGGEDKIVRLWNTGNSKEEKILNESTGAIYALAVSKNGQVFASGGSDKTLRIYTLNDGKLFASISTPSSIRNIAFHPSLPIISASLENRSVVSWVVPNQPPPPDFDRVIQTFSHTEVVTSLHYSDQGQLYSGSLDKSVKQWKLASDSSVRNLSHPHLVDFVSFDSTGELLASGCHDGIVRIWDLPKNAPRRAINAHTQPQPNPIYAVAWSPDGKQIVSASFDKSLKIWDVNSGNLVREIKGYKEKESEKGHRDQVFCVCFSKDGKRIASGSSDKTLKLWNTADGSLIREFINPRIKQSTNHEPQVAHPGWIYSLQFSADDKYLISVGSAPRNQGYLAIWNVSDGKQIFGSSLDTGPIYNIALSPDHTQAVLGCGPKNRQQPESEALLIKLPLK